MMLRRYSEPGCLPRVNSEPFAEHDRRYRYSAARKIPLPNCLEGYTTDDNARALIVAVLLNGSSHAGLSRRYLTFLWHVVQR